MLSGMLNKIIVLTLPFIIRTIIIRELGVEYAGLSTLFASILQVLNMTELGFSSAVIFSLYKPMADGDNDAICALMAFYRKIYRIVGVVILMAGIIIMPFLKYLIKGSYPDTINLYFLFVIYLVNTVFSYLAFAYKNVLLSASQRQDIINNVSSILDTLKCIIQIIVLIIWKNYYAYIIWNVIFTIANNLVVAYITKHRFPELRCKGIIGEEKKQKIVKQMKGLAISQVSKTTRNSLDSIVLSACCGLLAVTIYGNYYYVFSAVLGFLGVIVQSISAGVGNSVAIETVEKNYEDFKRFNYYMSWIGGWCTIAMLCLYQPFMDLWVGKELIASFEIMLLFCIYFYIVQMGQIRSVYSNAAGLWWEFRWLEIFEIIINLTLNISLGLKFGLAGIIFASIIAVFIFSIIGTTIITIRLYFKRSSAEYFFYCGVYCAVILIVAYFTYLICEMVVMGGILGLSLKLCIVVLLPNSMLFLISMLQKKHRNYLLALIRKNHYLV